MFPGASLGCPVKKRAAVRNRPAGSGEESHWPDEGTDGGTNEITPGVRQENEHVVAVVQHVAGFRVRVYVARIRFQIAARHQYTRLFRRIAAHGSHPERGTCQIPTCIFRRIRSGLIERSKLCQTVRRISLEKNFTLFLQF